jgi:hypothetical protein
VKRAVGADYAGGRWLMVGSGASRRSGRCERDLRACTSVTRVARETCALGEALQTSRKVSRTGCSAQSVATASQARRWSEMLVQRAARSCRRRPAARKARDAQGKMGRSERGRQRGDARADLADGCGRWCCWWWWWWWARYRGANHCLAAAAGASGCTQRAQQWWKQEQWGAGAGVECAKKQS